MVTSISKIFISLLIFYDEYNKGPAGLDSTALIRSVRVVYTLLQLTLISSFRSLIYINTTAT